MYACIFLCLFAWFSVFADPLVIGIAGGSGAGKTMLAQALQKQLVDNAAIIYMDNYFYDLSHLSPEERKKNNFDDPKSIDLLLLKQHITQLKKGHAVEQPIYHFKTQTRSSSTTHIDPVEIIIIDGFLLLASPEIYDLCSLKVFIEVEETERLFRIINRDQIERGFSLQETKQRYKDFVQPCYQKYIHDSKYQADLIIPNNLENKKAFQILLQLVKNHSCT
ncbi:uridine kinase [Candidatus Rhabdochlamydia sp. T3358]|uniref:uridine kinase n=1 Tax=Candidatus Rhabdochlamydia sp. T3358 TaxID=2099795 RepID=UPI0010B71975|nr:uridine kinase [Candidatus Rhabdochlamydia sp. T3358]VHO02060.1 Uridine kinase [Candidatus Rhabdochlamydia sp. T3358]